MFYLVKLNSVKLILQLHFISIQHFINRWRILHLKLNQRFVGDLLHRVHASAEALRMFSSAKIDAPSLDWLESSLTLQIDLQQKIFCLLR